MATMSPSPIRIQFRRSGGFAGISLTAATTADQLTGDHAAQVRRLLAEDQAPPGPRPAAAVPGAADRFQYELDLDDGQRQRSLTWDETHVPDELKPLVGTLTRLARPG
jgi:hypothetical protein